MWKTYTVEYKVIGYCTKEIAVQSEDELNDKIQDIGDELNGLDVDYVDDYEVVNVE